MFNCKLQRNVTRIPETLENSVSYLYLKVETSKLENKKIKKKKRKKKNKERRKAIPMFVIFGVNL